MFRLFIDHCFDNDITERILKRVPDLDVVTAEKLGLREAIDPSILERAAEENRILLTHDVATMIDYAADRLVRGLPMPGVVVIHQNLPVNIAVEELATFLSCSSQAAPIGTLLGAGVVAHLESGQKTVVASGATVLTGAATGGGAGFSCQNTLLRVSARQFLAAAEALQTEMFGNSSLIVVADSDDELVAVARSLEGNLTGCLYTATDGSDDALHDRIAPILRQKVGRLLNDKMPTGVAVVASMNHGGPFPATGHPGFTAVGIPGAVRRFAMLQCYDAVRPHRLPPALANKNPLCTKERARVNKPLLIFGWPSS